MEKSIEIEEETKIIEETLPSFKHEFFTKECPVKNVTVFLIFDWFEKLRQLCLFC